MVAEVASEVGGALVASGTSPASNALVALGTSEMGGTRGTGRTRPADHAFGTISTSEGRYAILAIGR